MAQFAFLLHARFNISLARMLRIGIYTDIIYHIVIDSYLMRFTSNGDDKNKKEGQIKGGGERKNTKRMHIELNRERESV